MIRIIEDYKGNASKEITEYIDEMLVASAPATV